MFPLTTDVDPDEEVTSDLIVNQLITSNKKKFPIFAY